MQKISYISFILCCLVFKTTLAQDKLFLRNNTIINCKIASINEKTVSYKDSVGGTQITTISKESIMMAEYKSGDVYVFGKSEATNNQNSKILNETYSERKERKMQEWKKQEETLSDNIIGFEPAAFFVGRYGMSYERLLANKSIGIKIPVILSYDYLSVISASNGLGTNTNSGAGFITGLDVNFYQNIKPNTKYYFGPRVRYGKDMLLGGIEGITAQITNGIFVSQGKVFTNTIGLGIGVFKQLTTYTSISNNTYNNKQLYPSISLTWRLGFRL